MNRTCAHCEKRKALHPMDIKPLDIVSLVFVPSVAFTQKNERYVALMPFGKNVGK
jgi:hypothetical protein